jgi:dTMP kinase
MLLITFEGIDGSGKSTQAQRLNARLQEHGADTLLVREPGGTELSEAVREILLRREGRVNAMAELLLFSAARAQLVAERVRPALEAGRIVLCDRFYDSTTAYQGAGRGVADPDWLRGLHARVTDGLVPDRTYLVELSPDEARQRRSSSGVPDDRMEAAADGFYDRVHRAYVDLAEAESDRFVRLDGTASIEVLHARIWDDVTALIDARRGTPFSSDGSSVS